MDEAKLLKVLRAAKILEEGGVTTVSPQDVDEADAEGFVEIVKGSALAVLTEKGRAELDRLAREKR